MAHGGNQRGLALGVFQQIVHQIRIAYHRPHIAQHFKQHPRRAPCFALAAQGFQSLPSIFTQQAANDFAVGIRGVVIGDFADALGMGHECVPCGLCFGDADWGWYPLFLFVVAFSGYLWGACGISVIVCDALKAA